MATPKSVVSLDAKKSFINKSREANYRESLRLEGFATVSNAVPKDQSLESVVAKYQQAEQ